MKINVLFFGITHDLTGFVQEQVELPEGENLEGLRRRYEARFPRLVPVGGSLLFAVNQEIANASTPLRDGDEGRSMPPVSGGAGRDSSHHAPPNFRLRPQLCAAEDGAVVVSRHRAQSFAPACHAHLEY